MTSSHLISFFLSISLLIGPFLEGGEFSLEENLYEEIFIPHMISTRDENFMISPYSLYNMGSLLWLGSSGLTAQEFEKLLFPYITKESHKKNIFLEDLRHRTAEYNSYFSSSTALFLDKKISFLPHFLNCVHRYWPSARMEKCGFQESSSESITQINNSIDEMTEHRIKNALSFDDIDVQTISILVNTLCFHADWKKPFDTCRTQQRPFFSGNQQELVQMCDMMEQIETFHTYSSDSGWVYIALPLQVHNKKQSKEKKNLQFLFEAILPPDNYKDISDSNYAREYIDFCRSARKKAILRSTKLYIPKCSLQKRIDLEPICKELGITSPFDPFSANFTKMSNSPLMLQKLFQKIQLSCNEDGVYVEAATLAGMRMKSSLSRDPEITIELNRPFFVTIREERENIPILFAHIVSLE